jgi:hypothetical protein
LAGRLDVFALFRPLEAGGVVELERCVVDWLGVRTGAGVDAWWVRLPCVVLELPLLLAGGPEPPAVVVVGWQLATTL